MNTSDYFGRDTMMAPMNPNEYVIPAPVVRHKGIEFFDKLIKQTLEQIMPPQYASMAGTGSPSRGFQMGGYNPSSYEPMPWWLFQQIYGNMPQTQGGFGGIPSEGLGPTTFSGGATPTTPPPGGAPYYTSPSTLDFSSDAGPASESPTFQSPLYGYTPTFSTDLPASQSPTLQAPTDQQQVTTQPPDVSGQGYVPGAGYSPYQNGQPGNPFTGNFDGGSVPPWLQDLGGVLFNTNVSSSPFLGGLAPPTWGLQVGVSGSTGGNVQGSETNKREALATSLDTAADVNMGNYWLNTYGYFPR